MRKIIYILLIVIIIYSAISLYSYYINNNESVNSVLIQKQIESDVAEIKNIRGGLDNLIAYMNSNTDVFPKEKMDEVKMISKDKRDIVLQTWKIFLDYNLALETLYEYYNKISVNKLPKKISDNVFKIKYCIFLLKYKYALEFIDIIEKNVNFDVILNQKIVDYKIPAKTYSDFKYKYLNVILATRFSAYELIYNIKKIKPLPLLTKYIEQDSKFIWNMGKGQGEKLTLENAVSIIKQTGNDLWLPVQKNVAELMSETRVLRKNENLISETQIEKLNSELKPGDVFFERREWYLTNLGIPGYWTHAALYIGTKIERSNYFKDDERVNEWVNSKGYNSFEDMLRKTFPKAYKASLKKDGNGFEIRILESVKTGVTFTSLEHSGCADSLGVLRPKLSKLDLARAIFKAFKYHKRPYDYEFNFLTDSKMICSELIFKVYEDKIKFPMSKVLGKLMTSPNDIVKGWAEKKEEARQYNFVLFLDANEKLRKSTVSNITEFKKTYKRPKWYLINDFK